GAVADALKTKFNGPIFLAGVANGRVSLIVAVPKDLTLKFQANKIIQEIAPIVGGKGGGRPESAQGGGTDTNEIGKALAKAKELLRRIAPRNYGTLTLGVRACFASSFGFLPVSGMR